MGGNTRESLNKMWPRLQAMHELDARRTYQAALRRGNKQTYEDFIEKIKENWIKDMLTK